jgi:hypothetical protein
MTEVMFEKDLDRQSLACANRRDQKMVCLLIRALRQRSE